MYSQEAIANGRRLAIIVGYAEKASWKMIELPPSLTASVDASLKREADRIAASIPSQWGRAHLSSDGFAVVDANTKQVVEWGPSLPEFLPDSVQLPPSPYQLYVHDRDLYLAVTDTNGRLLATSMVPLGDLWLLAAICVIAFLGTSIVAGALSIRFLRGYFAMTGVRVPTAEEALRSGEGQSVEFKRGLSDDETNAGNVEHELLKSIASFANTNDGVIFIGIDDAGHVRGLRLDFSQKDRMDRKIRQLVRNRIRPTPPFQITFEDMRGMVIVKIVVARGEAPVYMMNGVIYLRDGSSDVQAQPEDLKRLIPDYAF